MKVKNIVIGNLNKIKKVEIYDTEKEFEIKKQFEQSHPNHYYLIINNSYELDEISDKSYYFKIPFGKYKNKFVDLKYVDTVFSLMRIYFSLFGINEFSVYSTMDDKEQENEDNLCKVGDIVLHSLHEVRYYKYGCGWPDKTVPFKKVKELIKNGKIEDRIYGRSVKY